VKNMKVQVSPSHSRGAILLVSMVFLLLMALVAGTVMQTSMLEFKMAGNDQFREEAFQKAQAVSSSISEDVDNFPVVGDVGYTNCVTGDADPDCDIFSLTIDSAIASVPTGVALTAQVTREGPLILESFPVRLSESQTSSSPSYDAAIFEVVVEYSGSDVGLGNAEVAQGLAVRIVSSVQ